MHQHGRGLFRLTKDKTLVDAIASDFRTAVVPQKDRIMLEFAARLTTDPCHTQEAHVAELRKAGFEDRDVLDIVQIVAYYNYVNRLACGLGVELEDHWEHA